MDFSNEVAGKIPIPKLTHKNKPLVDKIIACVDKILAIKNSCHTGGFVREVSQSAASLEKSNNKRDISLNAQYDKTLSRDISGLSPQYDKEVADLEKQINDLVYKLYNLDSAEIQIVQGK